MSSHADYSVRANSDERDPNTRAKCHTIFNQDSSKAD